MGDKVWEMIRMMRPGATIITAVSRDPDTLAYDPCSIDSC